MFQVVECVLSAVQRVSGCGVCTECCAACFRLWSVYWVPCSVFQFVECVLSAVQRAVASKLIKILLLGL